MSILPAEPPVRDDSDLAAVQRLGRAFAAQRAAFALQPYPSAETRRRRIAAIPPMMERYRSRIAEALAADFGSHPTGAADVIEVGGPIARAQHALENLDRWMAEDPRELDPALYGDGRAYVRAAPKGVVGNIVPWNFPFDIAVGPLVDMLAAGNSVIIKPSDYTPASAALLAEMIAETFDPTEVDVAVGGLQLAQAFPELPWDHLLYTGSPSIGRKIMAAAVENLTPVTLELGGKCPALFLPGAVEAQAVEQLVGVKLIKNGQMCISIDYCLVPEPEVETFVDAVTAYMARELPAYSQTSNCTGIISARHLDRLRGMLEEARHAGARVVTTEPDAAPDYVRRRMPLTLVVDPPADLRLMRDEVFGPILAVIPYRTVEDALAHINRASHPLGVYVYGRDTQEALQVLDRTRSGGGVINGCALHGAIPSLGFGGVGESGMGRHHGIDGFREFSNPRGVVLRARQDNAQVFCPPYAGV
jgi:coniferyl-aldehyde dehydrogenase